MANSKVPAPTPLGLAASFGFGDRTGLATAGHIAALRKAGGGIKPIFAQQSIREMTRTNRTPEQVMGDALRAMEAAGYTGQHGADADHLKTPEDVDRTAAAGFTFFTIDPSDDVDPQADNYDGGRLAEKFEAVKAEVDWVEQYRGKTVKLKTGTTIDLNEQAVKRAAVKYGRAINRATRMAKHIAGVHQKSGKDYEIELSVDETPQPTTLAEHWIIAQQVLSKGMKLVSLAPRYIGDFEKGVDYKGDVKAFEKSLADHVAVMEDLGPYKLSLHSGSDKLSIYTPFARVTKGKWHVKTAGTSYLEMLRVVARHDEKLFRELIDFARGRYDVDKATYHVSAEVSKVPAPKDVKDGRELERLYLEMWPDVKAGAGFTEPGRQILHCTFGSTLTNGELARRIKEVLRAHPETFTEVLTEHFAKHLEALNRGMEGGR
ncbi:MAG TPA: tagaturonate epimerase family protein [Phycisphaerae bacterium]|nr:tagaturonate epimerase family protein [Phycisphaerae bacterium]